MTKSGHDKIRQLAVYLKKNPGDSFVKFALALELLKENQVTKAQVLFESVLEQDPGYLGVYYHLGKLYERQNRPADASRLYQKGISVARKQNQKKTEFELAEALEQLKQESDHDVF